MFHISSDKNKFGFYRVGGFATYSKFLALEYASRTNQSIDWVFNDDIFGRTEWIKEPAISIQELYRQRAQQIRDQFDFVVLMFSGGIDSANMLHSFFSNKIIPDEICSVHEYQGLKDKDGFLTGEIFNSAMPWVTANIPAEHHHRYRIVDTSTLQFKAVIDLNPDSIDRHWYTFNVAHNLGNIQRFNIRKLVAEYQKIIDSGKKLCLVWGECKPSIELDENSNRHCVKFSESGFDMICNAEDQEINDPNKFDEMFYTTPDMPEITVKQAHLCLQKLRSPERYPDEFVDTKKIKKKINNPYAPGSQIYNPILSQVTTVHNHKSLNLANDHLNSLIYPDCPPILYRQGKIINRIYHPRDVWLRKAAPELARGYYSEYVKKIKPWNDISRDKSKNGLLSLDKKYYIESSRF